MSKEEQYFAGDELAYDAWKSKYQLGSETLDEFFERIAREFARLDNFKNAIDSISEEQYNDLSDYGKLRIGTDRYRRFLDLFQDFKYIIPGGSVLAGIGSGKPVSLSNCFVIPTGDSIGEIFDTAREMAEIYKRRGGVGDDLSSIRPAGADVNNAAKTTGGVVPFMELFSQTTNTIGQDGRRGALMLSLDIRHPDSPSFIEIKQNLTKVTGANVSVRLNNEFMQAVKEDTDYILRWPCDHSSKWFLDSTITSLNYNELIELNNDLDTYKVYVKKIKAKELWETIIHCAWNTAEPGILFWDNIINNDPASVYPEFRAISTNPCGEIPLSAYDSCRLIATNLYGIVDNPFTDNAQINEDKAYKIFYEAQIIGDILVDLEIEAVKNIMSITKGKERDLWFNILNIGQIGRRTGVGITALADMLAALGSNFVNPELVEKVMHLKMRAELDATIDLAIINGPFPAYNVDNEWINANETDPGIAIAQNEFYHQLRQNFPLQCKRMLKWGRRNISWSTIAPTGTISIQAGVSSGGETTFSIYYVRRKKCNTGETPDFIDQNGVGFKNYNVVHGTFKKWLNIFCNLTNEMIEDLSTEKLDELILNSPWHNNTAPDILPFDRVKIQATLQKYTTHSISSTINLPKEATEEDIATIYMEASKQGCKGITVYRDGSRTGILVKHEETPKFDNIRPEKLDCKVLRFKNEDKKNWISFVGIYNNKAYEIFTGINDLDELPIPSYIEEGMIVKVILPEGSRYDFSYVDKYGYVNTVGGLNRVFNKEYWNYARFVSALLRQETPIEQVIKVVDGLTFTNKGMNSFQAGLIRSMKAFIPNGTAALGAVCENCGSHNIIYEGGCMICRDCGSSHCG